MKFDWKKALRAVLMSAFILVFVGGGLMLLFVMASLGLTPLYVTQIIPVAGIALLAALLLTAIGYLPPRWVKRVWSVFLAILMGCGIWAGRGFYHDSIPTVDERTLMLWEYEPFTEGTKAVTLDEPATLHFDSPFAVKLDGATALYPVYASFVQAVYPPHWEETGITIDYNHYKSDIQCTGTIKAYDRLIQGETDMIFAAGPSQAQLDAAKKAGVELHLTPIGREAFVFFVNGRNPVTGLTVEEIQGIYTGEITNWEELGGKNQSIRPFQRAENSGSQTALQNLMAGLPLLEPEKEDEIGGMGEIITQVASYRNYKNAIGFSFRFYASEMEANDQIKLLALNGVPPTRETIRDGSYPIASYFYAITAAPIGQPAPEETDEDLAVLLEWILSPQGQEIVERTGYVSLE